MKKKRILCTLVLSTILIISSIMMSTVSYAATSTFGLSEYRQSGIGYKILDQKVWKVYKQNNGTIDYNTIVYCLRAGQGFYSETPGKFSDSYNASYDFKNKSAIPNMHTQLSTNYKSILWLLDNSYIPSSENASADKTALLTAALGSNNASNTELTDHDIDMIQQLAIWYFTNEDQSKYHKDINGQPELNNVFQAISPSTNYQHIDDINTYRYADMQELYTYLVSEAKKTSNLTQYDGNISSAPISLAKTNPTAEYDETNSRYILGPYKIEKNNTLPYTLTKAEFTTQNGSTLTGYQLLNSNKQQTSLNIQQLVGQEFYIAVPETVADNTNKIDFTIEGSYKSTNMTYWTISNAANTTQPLVEINKTPNPIEGTVSVPVEKIPEKIFDLALRKFISDVNGQTFNRAPTVDVAPLKVTPVNPNNHTAIYSHSKEPITIKTGDIITYTIRVYNEGDIDAFAGEITDYLPEELEFINDLTNHPTETRFNATNGWVIDPSNPRIIKTTKLARSNNAANNTQNVITAFNGTTLSYKEIQIKCKVKDAIKSKKITNLAQITAATDKNGNNVADIDSQPDGGFTLPSDTELPNYKDDEWEQVKDGNRYVPGQQDDDDYEKVIVKNFDIALRKYITGINDSEVLGRIPEPDIAPLNNGTSTTALYNHTKKPLGVQIGDIVTYTIRVYNEGEVDGYANEITDYLPAELEFIEDDATNRKYEWQATSNGRVVTTKYLSKEKETSSRENILKAFNGTNLDSKYVEIRCKVKDTAKAGIKITNIAAITEYKDENGNDVTDIDSAPETIPDEIGNDSQLPSYKDSEIASGDRYIPGQQDDDDFEKLVLKGFDLALRKYITAINNSEVLGREPKPDITPLKNGTSTTAIYNGSKQPVTIKIGDTVTYTIRAYNEGEVDGYANKITDYLPEDLEFLPDDEINKKYEWEVSTDGKTVTTKYLSKEKESETRDNLLKGFDGTTLDSKYVEIRCKVKEKAVIGRKITNIAAVTENADKNGNIIKDRDSDPDKVPDEIGDDTKLPPYKDEEISKGDKYIPGQEDDDDFEKLVTTYFDLALKKFITGVEDTEITNRIPKVSMGTDGNLKYESTKTPLEVVTGNTLTYTIRVYNEGLMNGYASEIVDNVPEGLEFLPDNESNKEYRWEMYEEVSSSSKDKDLFEYAGKKYKKTTKAIDADIIKTDYLSKEQEKTEGANLIKAFDSNRQISETNPDYKDVIVKFKVTEKDPSKIIINIAEISDDRDEDNNPVEDKDSEPGNGKGEDDLDEEHIKVQLFDLALKKWVSKVIIIDGDEQKVTDTGHTGNENPEPIIKVDLHRKKLNEVTVKFEFQIKVTNEGQIEGYAKEVTDYIPEGLKFIQEDNSGWYTRDALNGRQRVATRALENKLLKPGESASVPIVLTWINDSDNMGLKTNIAEISEDYNDKGVPDIDSTPDNFKDKEDDQDDAPVMLAIILGKEKMFLGLSLLVLATIGVGIFLIKKYVLCM